MGLFQTALLGGSFSGFRFGKAGWEFAFGPSFGLARTSTGFFDHEGIYDPTRYGKYWTRDELGNAGFDNSASALEENGYFYKKTLDKRGDYKFSTKWIMAVGRTFKSGALNVPVNVFYSSIKKGGMVGLSVGFNITRKKNITIVSTEKNTTMERNIITNSTNTNMEEANTVTNTMQPITKK